MSKKIINLSNVKTCKKQLHQYSSELRQCPECLKLARKRKYRENPEKQKASSKKWYEKNKRRACDRVRSYNANNIEKIREYKKEWRDKNRLRYREYMQKAAARRKAQNLRATPKWANLEAINAIYEKCARLSKETKIKHHVDHIYPLKNKYLCGLHVENNLQILTAAENLKKGNRSWPGQLDCQRH